MNRALRPLDILVIEDCEDDYELLLLKLRESGFLVTAHRVETVAELQAALETPRWQIVISDFDLPGFDGLRALDLVRSRNADVPFFVVSGVIDEEQAVAAMKAGAQDYFFKGKLKRLGPAVTRELCEFEQRREQKRARVQLDHDRNVLRHDRIRFVDIMSHEFRTPLNIINVSAGMLGRYGDRMDSADRARRVAEIQEGVARMTSVIDDVLLTSRIELHQWELQVEIFNLAAWCDEFLAHHVTGADQRRRVRVNFEGLPDVVALDRRVIEIALENLISNALKYSPPDSTVDLEVSAQAPDQIVFTVRDHGIGIPQTDIAHVFDSFFRGSNVGDAPGSGLGLAIVRGCADLHKGSIKIDSQPGAGTSISMFVPGAIASSGTAQGLLEAEVIQP